MLSELRMMKNWQKTFGSLILKHRRKGKKGTRQKIHDDLSLFFMLH